MHMRKELPHFDIEGFYGGSQDWFSDGWMKMGGCGAATMCDCCIYFDRYKGTKLYPYDAQMLSKADYERFAMEMKPYLRPRFLGISRTAIFLRGARRFLKDRHNVSLQMTSLEGRRPVEEAKAAVIKQIDAGLPIPYLNLFHQSPKLKEYVWHWFILNGYELRGDRLMVKAVTYGGWEWLDFEELWNTGHRIRGGMVLFSMKHLS